MKVTTINVKLSGLSAIMFDRYSGDNKTQLDVRDKMYYMPDGQSLCLPAANFRSFLSAQNTTSAPKLVLDSRKYKTVAQALLSSVAISPNLIPFTAQSVPVVFGGEWSKQIWIHRSVARVEKGIPNPKERPVLECPWELAFRLEFFENSDIQLKGLQDLIARGGYRLGLGTFRGVFGKFEIAEWAVVEEKQI